MFHLYSPACINKLLVLSYAMATHLIFTSPHTVKMALTQPALQVRNQKRGNNTDLVRRGAVVALRQAGGMEGNSSRGCKFSGREYAKASKASIEA